MARVKKGTKAMGNETSTEDGIESDTDETEVPRKQTYPITTTMMNSNSTCL
jgi:hypothetical protein